MDDTIEARLDRVEQKVNLIYESVEKTRKYFMWTLIISVAMVVLPIIAAAIMIPFIMSAMNSMYGEIGALGGL